MLEKTLWEQLSERGAQALALEKMRVATELRVDRAGKHGIPTFLTLPLQTAAKDLKKLEKELERQIRQLVRGTPEDEWVRATPGMGTSFWLVIAALPRQPGEYRTVSALWKGFGLHVHEGSAVKRRAGESGDHQRFRQIDRARALYRIGLPHVKTAGGSVTYKEGQFAGQTHQRKRSPYRDVYDDRREQTQINHPAMRDEEGELLYPECPTCLEAVARTNAHRAGKHYQRERQALSMDCGNLGGLHWEPGHRHADALRVTTKAVLRDVYRLWNGQEPLYAGRDHWASDTQPMLVASGV